MKNRNMKGYKVFNPDWTYGGFQFEVGKTFTEDIEPQCDKSGFHFYTKAVDCFWYYYDGSGIKFAEVEACGDVDASNYNSKCSTNKIHIIREITWQEMLDMVNTGKHNTGRYNTGNYNSGDYNSGYQNSGNRNSGDWNKTNFSNGCFNTESQKIFLFNQPSEWTYLDWLDSDARRVLTGCPSNVLSWIRKDCMTDEEKEQHPEYSVTGGFLKYIEKETGRQRWWDELPMENKNIVMQIPNFDKDIFNEITGIDVDRRN